MKFILPFLLLLILLSSCTSSPQNDIEKFEPAKITPIVPTLILEPTQPAGTLEMYLPKECMARDPNIDYENYDWRELKTIGGCSLMSTSPDERFTAYSTIVCLTESEPRICGEAVKLLERGKHDGTILYFFQPREKLMVSSMGWSSQSDLVFSMADINGERITYVLGDFTSNPNDFSEKAYLYGGYVQWNESRTAFITQRFGTEGDCQFGISGYDFSTHTKFPEISFDERIGTNPISVETYVPGVPTGGWWDDSKIYLLITPFEIGQPGDIQVALPQKVGMIELTSNGVKFEILNDSPSVDYYFSSENGKVVVKSKPYKKNPLCGPRDQP
jgi:hypothetical protein